MDVEQAQAVEPMTMEAQSLPRPIVPTSIWDANQQEQCPRSPSSAECSRSRDSHRHRCQHRCSLPRRSCSRSHHHSPFSSSSSWSSLRHASLRVPCEQSHCRARFPPDEHHHCVQRALCSRRGLFTPLLCWVCARALRHLQHHPQEPTRWGFRLIWRR